MAAAAVVLAGCRSATPRKPPTGGVPTAAWEIPGTEIGRQSLYRVQLRAGGERGSLRLVLRLWAADRFELAASDALGRSLWSLSSWGDAGVWSNRDRKAPCALAVQRPMHWPRFGLTFPASYLPALLLGRLPEPPAAPPATGETEFEAASGRRFRLTVAADQLVRWSVAGDTPESTLSWTREEDGGRLEAAGPEELEIRWRRVSSEPVSGRAARFPSEALVECELEDFR